MIELSWLIETLQKNGKKSPKSILYVRWGVSYINDKSKGYVIIYMKQNENQNIKNLAKNNAFIAFIYLDATLLSVTISTLLKT